jgi:hypothetical protein
MRSSPTTLSWNARIYSLPSTTPPAKRITRFCSRREIPHR